MLKTRHYLHAAMPEKYWKGPIAFIVLGLIFCILVGWFSWHLSADIAEARVARQASYLKHIEYAKDSIRQACKGGEPAEFLDCVTEEVIASKDHSRAESDLDAQQSMATWAMIMAYVSIAGLLATSVGAILVWQSLLVTREAVKVTRDIGKTQTRAYVDIAKAHFFWGNRNRTRPRVELWVRSFGETPAKWYEVRSHCFVIPREYGPLIIPWHELSDVHRIGKWSPLVEGDDRKLTVNLQKHQEDISKTVLEFYGNHAFEFYVFGDVKYCTFHDEIFTTQFCFGRVNMPDYDADTKEKASQRGVRNFSPERPVYLARPTCDLDAYKIISG